MLSVGLSFPQALYSVNALHEAHVILIKLQEPENTCNYKKVVIIRIHNVYKINTCTHSQVRCRNVGGFRRQRLNFLPSETGPVVPHNVMNPTRKRLITVTLDHRALLGILVEKEKARKELLRKPGSVHHTWNMLFNK